MLTVAVRLSPPFCAHVALDLAVSLPFSSYQEAPLEKLPRELLGCKQARRISEAGGCLHHLPAKSMSPELLESPISTRYF